MPTAPPSTNTPTISVAAASAVLRVGDGRGFVVECRNHLGYDERIVVTAAHCLVDVFLANGTQGLPSCHPARYTEDGTYKALLGPLGAEPTVWATCLFVDPIAGIAVLGQPDNQVLIDEAAAFDALMDSVRALAIADAPAQGSELVTGFGGRQFENLTPARGSRGCSRSKGAGSRAVWNVMAAVCRFAPDCATPGWPKRFCATSRKQNWRWSRRDMPMSPL